MLNLGGYKPGWTYLGERFSAVWTPFFFDFIGLKSRSMLVRHFNIKRWTQIKQEKVQKIWPPRFIPAQV